MSVYSETMKPIGDKLLLKKLLPTMDKRFGDILIPQSVQKNNTLGVAEIIDLGEIAKETGLKIGDFVLYDYFSVYHNNMDFVITKAENIILCLTKEEAEDYATNAVIKIGKEMY
jgi:co-chaperonin GroES (HSP10)